MNLQKDLPILLPRAIAWAQEQSGLILRHGVPLDEQGMALAKHVGVAKPELVRIQYVAEVPAPEDPMLRAVTDAAEFIGPHTTGMTFGYGIFIVESHAGARLISHELRHVQQYESLGGIEAFLSMYLAQVAAVGYYDAPLEQDARAHEVDAIQSASP